MLRQLPDTTSRAGRGTFCTHHNQGEDFSLDNTLIVTTKLIPKSLIIASLVLFLEYGQPKKTAEENRVEELEQALNKLSRDNTKLQKEKAELTGALKAKTGEKNAADKEIAKLKNYLNTSYNSKNLQKTLSNFSQTVEYLKADLDNAVKDKNEHHTQVIQLRQEKIYLKSQLDVYTKKCKEDFADSLPGIQTVSNAFLTKIDNFFTNLVMFHLTCQKQMNMIPSNSSRLFQQTKRSCLVRRPFSALTCQVQCRLPGGSTLCGFFPRVEAPILTCPALRRAVSSDVPCRFAVSGHWSDRSSKESVGTLGSPQKAWGQGQATQLKSLWGNRSADCNYHQEGFEEVLMPVAQDIGGQPPPERVGY
ncbi:hypothetical protein DPX16_9021 [Anabarilius grahami]|uniref:Uncharacterized protein n=1 Tax=Anabarilius grahami TaxID=495550 RepID=A0A3N0YJ80_ANAGA|nr:hypothetical protein DPX16_9021 [Anabarilius grahami]